MFYPSVGVSDKRICWNYFKDCLIKLYYLHNKITKKLGSLKEITDELDGLVNLTNSIIMDDCVTPIRACGTRWIGYLVKASQRANQQIWNLFD